MSDPIRQLHRIIDARIARYMSDNEQQVVRGTVTSVASGLSTLSATLDGGTVPTPGIAYPSSLSPAVGDDVLVVRRRRDGFLVVLSIL